MRNYTIKIFLLLMIFSTGPQNIFAKGLFSKADSLILARQFTRANKFYRNMAYVKAIDGYEGLKLKGFTSDSLNRNLAQAYFKISAMSKSEALYSQLVLSSFAQPSDYYFLAQSLKYNGKYKEADEWMGRFNAVTPSDSRGVRQLHAITKIEELLAGKSYSLSTVSFNSSNSDFGAVDYGNKVVFASARENTLVVKRTYAWNDTPYLDLFSVTLAGDSASSIAVPFSSKLNSIYHDGPLCFSADESEVFFTRNNFFAYLPKSSKEGVNNLKILYAKTVALGSWGEVKELSFNSNSFSTGHPSLSVTGDTLYFSSDRPGGFGNSDIYFVTRIATGWSEVQNMGPQINTEGDEMFPFIDRSGLLYFSSNGHLGLGGLDVFVTPKGYDGNFVVKNLGAPINSSSDDFAFFQSKNLTNGHASGFIASNRSGGLGDDDIYAFSVLKPISFNTKLLLKGAVFEAVTNKILNNSVVSIKNSKKELIKTFDTQSSNSFELEVQPTDHLVFETSNDRYLEATTSVDLSTMDRSSGVVTVPLYLTRRPVEAFWGLTGNVFLLPSHEVVPKVEISIKPRNGSAERLLFSDSLNGGFHVRLAKDVDYDIVFQKRAFFTKRVQYSTVGRDTGWVNINQFVELSMKKAELGASIEIKVLYDLGKSNIRPDAAQELDDMAAFLNDNPTISIELSSHTDSRGSDASNQALSQRRAESATAYIVAKGIAASRIVSVGYGESRLKNRCANGVKCTEQEHQQNRRTEVKIIGM